MNKMRQIRKSVWIAICIWLGFAKSYESAQAEVTVPEITRNVALDILKAPLMPDPLLSIFSRTANGIRFGYSPVLRNVDDPKVAFVDLFLRAARPARMRYSSSFYSPTTPGTGGCGTGNPSPPPLPPVSTVPGPTGNPVPPLSCTQITQHTVCVKIGDSLVHQCVVNDCCLRGNAIDHCAQVSAYSYISGILPGTSTTGTGWWSRPCTGGQSHSAC